MKVRSRYLLVMAIAWGPCLLAAAASYAVVLRPQLDSRKTLTAQVESSKEKYTRAVEAAKEKDQDRLAEQVKGLHSRVDDFVVSRTDAPDLAFRINELANEAKLASLGMRPANRSGPETLSNFERVEEKRVDLTFAAGFRRFAAFLNTLERHHPVVFVETFAINHPTEKDAEPQASLGLALLVEKAAEPAEASK
jgi:hypothetical protein